MGLHARLSASQTKEWAACPGQIAVKEYMDEIGDPIPDVPGDAARLGTVTHALIEHCLGEGHYPLKYDGRIMEILDEGEDTERVVILGKSAKWPSNPQRLCFEVDEEMIEAATHMTDYVAARCVHYGLADEATPAAIAELVKSGEVRLETRTNLLPHRNDTGGTADVTIIVDDLRLVEIVDYKHGIGVYVPIEENPQLRSYGMGVVQEVVDFYITDSFDVDIDEVRYTICQPRHFDTPEDGIMSETISLAELIEWRDGWLTEAITGVDVARQMMDAARDEFLQLHDREMTKSEALQVMFEHDKLCCNRHAHKCWFCSGQTDYPGARKKLAEMAGVDFEDEPLDPEKIDVSAYVTDNPEELAEILSWEKFFMDWFANVNARAMQLAMDRQKIPGKKLVLGTKHKVWVDSVDTEMVAAHLIGMGVRLRSAYKKRDVITPAQAIKELKSAGVPPDEISAFSEQFISKPTGEPKLVDRSARGAEYIPTNAADDFGDDL